MKPCLTQDGVELPQLLQRCPPDLRARMKQVDHGPGSVLIRQGDRPRSVYLLSRGLVKATHVTVKGSQYVIGVFGAGELFGEIEIVGQSPCIASVECLDACRAWVIPRQTYLGWLRADFDFVVYVHESLSWRLRNASEKGITAMSYPLEYSILKLVAYLGEHRDSGFRKPDIADYLGTSVRVVNRILSNLTRQGLVETSKGEIAILDQHGLQAAIDRYE